MMCFCSNDRDKRPRTEIKMKNKDGNKYNKYFSAIFGGSHRLEMGQQLKNEELSIPIITRHLFIYKLQRRVIQNVLIGSDPQKCDLLHF